MKGKILILFMLCLPLILFAEADISSTEGREIENLVSVVKAADAGDYILLPSGRKYVLTKAEISIANGIYDYETLPDVQRETLDDGVEKITISEAHTAYSYPDGQIIHNLKTHSSFEAFMNFIESKYHITMYIDDSGETHEWMKIKNAKFDVFRAGIQFQTISNGDEELDSVIINAFNYKGENFTMKFCSAPEMAWGNISNDGMYLPVGESYEFKFNIGD